MAKRGNIQKFYSGPSSISRHNDTIHTVNFLTRKGDEELVISRRRTSGGGVIRNAYCKVAASTGATIVCYLDTDATGDEITVTCTLIGTTNLNECFPTLSDGTMMPVWYDNAGEVWRSLWWFQKKEACPA